jgi:hypothetical protein
LPVGRLDRKVQKIVLNAHNGIAARVAEVNSRVCL